MTEPKEAPSALETRAAQLAQMQPQQLLAYIAALMETVLQTQVTFSKAVMDALGKEIRVTGAVTIKDNDWLPLKVEVENYPLEVKISNEKVAVEVKNEVKIDADSISPLHVEVTNSPLDVEVTNTPLEVVKY
jgi:hypothetical protein